MFHPWKKRCFSMFHRRFAPLFTIVFSVFHPLDTSNRPFSREFYARLCLLNCRLNIFFLHISLLFFSIFHPFVWYIRVVISARNGIAYISFFLHIPPPLEVCRSIRIYSKDGQVLKLISTGAKRKCRLGYECLGLPRRRP